MAGGPRPRPRLADRGDPVAASAQARRLRDRRLLPAEGPDRARPQAQRDRRRAVVRGLGRRRRARRAVVALHARGKGARCDRLPRPSVRRGAAVRRHARPLEARHLDAWAARNVGSPRALVHGRGVRLRPADRGAAGEEADPDHPQAGSRVRRRHRARDPEPGRPRLQGDVERRHVAGRPAADRARQGPRPRRAQIGCGRYGRRRPRRGDRRSREAAVPAREREELAAADLCDPLGDVVPPRSADEGPGRVADEGRSSCGRGATRGGPRGGRAGTGSRRSDHRRGDPGRACRAERRPGSVPRPGRSVVVVRRRRPRAARACGRSWPRE